MNHEKSRRQFVKQSLAVSAFLAIDNSFINVNKHLIKSTQKKIKTDVVVCGGGCAGLAAALSAARAGAKTLLVERAGFSGGIITCVGLPYFDGMVDKYTGRFVNYGIAHEFLIKTGAAKPGAKSLDDCNPRYVSRQWSTVTIPNTEYFKLLADQLIAEQSDRLSVLYHSSVCDAEVKDGRISSITIANKDGLVSVEARQVIDCTGDGDVASFSGCPVERTTPLMPLTLHFRIGNVKKPDVTRGKLTATTTDMGTLAKQEMIKAHERGELPAFYGPGLIFAFADDEVYVHAIRVSGDASNAADLTRCEMQGRKDAWVIFNSWKKNVPGFEDSYFITSGPYIGIRESRRIVGKHILTLDDLRTGIQYDDAIASGSWFLDVHPNQATTDKPYTGDGYQPKPYHISYRTLVPEKISNLLVAGRCHSATAEAASSSRVTVTAMAMGEAAGVAAAIASQQKKEVGLISGIRVREQLMKIGAGPVIV